MSENDNEHIRADHEILRRVWDFLLILEKEPNKTTRYLDCAQSLRACFSCFTAGDIYWMGASEPECTASSWKGKMTSAYGPAFFNRCVRRGEHEVHLDSYGNLFKISEGGSSRIINIL